MRHATGGVNARYRFGARAIVVPLMVGVGLPR